MKTRFSPMALAISALACPPLWAQGIATEQQLAPVMVTGTRQPLDPNLPSTTASVTKEELRDQNLFNPEDALRYLPSTSVRKRYIGDRNALLGGRSFTSLQAARGLVFMDGYLLSNFLGRFDAPRWNMVAPEEIDRIDVLFGPFSALYPGNSIGSTVAIATRIPKKWEASARVTGAFQSYEAYGHEEDANAWQTSLFLGDRLPTGLAYSVSLNHQESTSQPMQYYTVSRNAAGSFPAVSSVGATPVTGVAYDIDPKGFERAVFGANSGAIDRTEQDQMKLRLAYPLSPALLIDGFVAVWDHQSTSTNRPFIRDAAGNVVWSGRVLNNGQAFNIPAATFAPSKRDETHTQAGFTLKTKHATGWNGSLVVSTYRIGEDQAYQAGSPEPSAQFGGSGTLTRRDGTQWSTFEAQTTYTPSAGDWGAGQHTLVLGVHHNTYRLTNRVYDLADWRMDSAPALSQNVGGRTRVTALYAQDAWQLSQRWKATLGARWEDWTAEQGAQFIAGAGTVAYPSRSIQAASPKLSLAWTPDDAWLVRGSYGRGVRFPTVVELFQGTRTGSSIQLNDPNLQPEKSNSLELSAERGWGAHQVRASLFQEDIRDTIFSQTNTTVVPNVTNVQNVGRVRARGLELAWTAEHWLAKGLRWEANATWVDAKTLESQNLASIGKQWVRVPKLRANAAVRYAMDDRWSTHFAVRHSGRQYAELDNSDMHGDTFGGISSYTAADVKVTYRPRPKVELALGIDNLTNEKIYVYHPMPGRTVMAELRWEY